MLWTSIHSTFIAASAFAAPPVDEIRKIVAQKSLWPQSSESLAALDIRHLEAALLAIDAYARYVPSTLSGDSSPSVHLGIEAFVYKSRLWIRPDQGGPADQAGIPEIGELKAINGKTIQGDDLAKVSALLDKAVRETQVNLTISARSGRKGKAYRVTPAVYQSSSITWRRVGADIVIRITEFVSHDTAPRLSAILTTLDRPGTRFVVDLRGCSGGDLYEALEIAGMFVPFGLPLASTYDRSGVVQTYQAPSGRKPTNPVWLLIDHRTASSAEILAGILQHHHLARVIGERSYGKCVSQTLVPLSDGGGLWLTTLGVNFPDKTSCNGKGIIPDTSYPDISIAKLANIIEKINNDIPVFH